MVDSSLVVLDGKSPLGEDCIYSLELRVRDGAVHVRERLYVGGKQAHSRLYPLYSHKAEERMAKIGFPKEILMDRASNLRRMA